MKNIIWENAQTESEYVDSSESSIVVYVKEQYTRWSDIPWLTKNSVMIAVDAATDILRANCPGEKIGTTFVDGDGDKPYQIFVTSFKES